MPELPEVETVRRGLEQVVGREISGVDVLHTRPVRRHLAGPQDVAIQQVGQHFLTPMRRGKFLWLPMSGGDALLAHLGMSGQFRLDAPGTEHLRNTRVVWHFADGGDELRFVDQRMFGGVSISPGGAELPDEVAHIAIDPVDPAFSAADLTARLRASSRGIKRLLLDQTVVSGIGNIYADEALWRAKLHYATPGASLSARKANELIGHIVDILTDAIAVGGTSFDALYVNVNGESGYFDRSLDAYGREDEPCHRCGTPIVREHFMNRSSFRCLRCQRLR